MFIITQGTVFHQDAVTLRSLWSAGYQAVVSYEHNLANCHTELWSHIPYWWANKCKAEALIEEFERRKQHGRPGNLRRNIFINHTNVNTFFSFFLLQIKHAYVFSKNASLWRGSIWPRTWSTSVLIPRSRSRTWSWRHIQCCWAGFGSRNPDPTPTRWISLLPILW